MNSLEFVVSASERNNIFVVWLSECLTDKQEFIGESLQEVRLIVGAVGIPARGTASCFNLLSILLQCRRQECPRLLQFALSIVDFSSNSYF